MSRMMIGALTVFAMCLTHSPVDARQSCAAVVKACPNGGKPTGPWPFCGCKQPRSCPKRNHQYVCRGATDSFGGEASIQCECLDAPPNGPRPPPGEFCKRMQTPDGGACHENSDGACDCSANS